MLTLFNQELIIAGTGHRPDKLAIPGFSGYHPQTLIVLTDFAIQYFEKSQPTKIISGMALGWDTAIALAALALKIPLLAYVPFANQDCKWQLHDRHRYHKILNQATEIKIVCGGSYEAWKMQTRNEAMIDDCTRLAALWNGDQRGGTTNAVRYAVKQKVDIDYLWQSWLDFQKCYIY